VKSHRGFIQVQSALNEGSVFTVYLPRSRGDSRPARAETHETPKREEVVRNLSILVVDDDPMVRRVLCDMLSRIGHQATEADGVRSAVTLLMKDWGAYDLLVVDVLMPEKDGFALVDAVRGAGSEIPILLCTGYSCPEVFERGAMLSRVHLLPKPFDMKTLADAVANASRRP